GEYRARFIHKMSNKELIQKKKFYLNNYQGLNGYIEVIDSTTTGSVGVGKIEPAILNIPDIGPAQIAELEVRAAKIVADCNAVTLEPELRKLLAKTEADYKSRTAAASTLMSLS